MASLKAQLTLGALLTFCFTLLHTHEAMAQTKPSQVSREVQQHIDKIAGCLTGPIVEKDDPHACHSLKDRMAELHIPGVSVAVIHNGAIEWAQGFGVAQLGGKPVTTEHALPGGLDQQAARGNGGTSSRAARQALARHRRKSNAHFVEDPRQHSCSGADRHTARTPDPHRRNDGSRLPRLCGGSPSAYTRSGAQRRKACEYRPDPS